MRRSLRVDGRSLRHSSGSGRSPGWAQAGVLPWEAVCLGPHAAPHLLLITDDKEPALGPLPHSHPLPPTAVHLTPSCPEGALDPLPRVTGGSASLSHPGRLCHPRGCAHTTFSDPGL